MILVTGATGLVGSRLAFDLVHQGHSVRALKRPGRNLGDVQKVFSFYDTANGPKYFAAVEWVEGDILDTESLITAFEGIDTVYHSAGLVSYRKKDLGALIAVNQEGTANMVNAALGAGVKKFCHISSVAALGKTKGEALINELCEWKPEECASNYSLSKYSAEQEVWRGIAEGLNAVIVNPSIILGPAAANQSSGMLMDMLQKGLPYFPGGKTGYIDVRDVSNICVQLMQLEIENERFILSGENISYEGMLGIGAKTFNKSTPKFKVSKILLEFAWMASSMASLFGIEAKITKETARSASRISIYDNAKIKGALNTEFIGVAESLEYYRAFFA